MIAFAGRTKLPQTAGWKALIYRIWPYSEYLISINMVSRDRYVVVASFSPCMVHSDVIRDIP